MEQKEFKENQLYNKATRKLKEIWTEEVVDKMVNVHDSSAEEYLKNLWEEQANG